MGCRGSKEKHTDDKDSVFEACDEAKHSCGPREDTPSCVSEDDRPHSRSGVISDTGGEAGIRLPPTWKAHSVTTVSHVTSDHGGTSGKSLPGRSTQKTTAKRLIATIEKLGTPGSGPAGNVPVGSTHTEPHGKPGLRMSDPELFDVVCGQSTVNEVTPEDNGEREA